MSHTITAALMSHKMRRPEVSGETSGRERPARIRERADRRRRAKTPPAMPPKIRHGSGQRRGHGHASPPWRDSHVSTYGRGRASRPEQGPFRGPGPVERPGLAGGVEIGPP